MQERMLKDLGRRTPLIRVLVDKGLAENAAAARLAIMSGVVTVDGSKVENPQTRYPNGWLKGKVLRCGLRQVLIS
jgi:ribosomal protein S4